MTGPVVSRYIATRRQSVSPATINKEIGLLSSAFNWVRKDLGWDVVNPVQGRRLNEGQGRIRWLTRAEAAALMRAAESQVRAPHLVDFIRLGLHTGMRKGEMLGLEWRRVDLHRGLVYLEAEHQKNGRFGSVPLNEEARVALLARARFRATHCPQSKWVFCRNDGMRIRDIKGGFQTACTNAGIENLRPHDLRHTCAAWSVQAGVPLREVAELLRHADIRMTMRYAHLAPENVRKAVTDLEGFWSHFGHTTFSFNLPL